MKWLTVLVLSVALIPACASWQKDTKTVLDVLTEACVVEHMTWANAEIEAFCGVAKELIPAVESLLAEQRAAAKKAAEQKPCQSK